MRNFEELAISKFEVFFFSCSSSLTLKLGCLYNHYWTELLD